MGALDWISAVTPATRAIAKEIDDRYELPHYPPPQDGEVIWGYNPGGAEHGTGRALDVMVRNDSALGDKIADWLWDNRVRFDLTHMIWKQRIRSTVTAPGVWRQMEDRGGPTNNHMDHIHVLFGGADIEPQERYWTPTSTRTTEQIQALVGVTVDGDYGPATREAVRALQTRLGVTADGYFGPSTEAAYEASLKTSGGGAQSMPKPQRPSGKPKPAASKAPKFPLPRGHWYGVESSDKRNHSGYYAGDRAGIKTWQAQMRKRGWTITVDGRFGKQSEKVAKAFQSEKRISVDGAVGAVTWSATWSEPVT